VTSTGAGESFSGGQRSRPWGPYRHRRACARAPLHPWVVVRGGRRRNGREALEVLRSQAASPGLILLDLMMPVMNGWELRAELAKAPASAAAPVVVFSGAGHVRQPAAEMDVAEVLEKPVDAPVLLEVVARHYRQGAPSA